MSRQLSNKNRTSPTPSLSDDADSIAQSSSLVTESPRGLFQVRREYWRRDKRLQYCKSQGDSRAMNLPSGSLDAIHVRDARCMEQEESKNDATAKTA